jgi:hypothetical protein
MSVGAGEQAAEYCVGLLKRLVEYNARDDWETADSSIIYQLLQYTPGLFNTICLIKAVTLNLFSF